MSRSIFTAYNDIKYQLEKIAPDDYVFEAKQIIKHITGYSNREILEKYYENLTESEERHLTEIMEKRKMRYPLQYIFGVWEFYGLPFFVGPGVLIPRADTETLVEKAIELIKDKKDPKVLDLCSGSGCIAVSIAKNLPCAQVVAVEKYDKAFSFAKKNVKENNTQNVKLIKGDIFECAAAEDKYDIILSNPPYLTKDDMENLQPEVKYEPETALAGGEDGLLFYRAIANNYKNSLKSGGILCFEIGAVNNRDGVEEILRTAGFEDIGTTTDIEDRHRVIFGTYNNL